MEDPSPEYIESFNNGYLLAKYNPGLVDSLIEVKSSNTLIQGLRDGVNSFRNERVKSRLKEINKTKKGLDFER